MGAVVERVALAVIVSAVLSQACLVCSMQRFQLYVPLPLSFILAELSKFIIPAYFGAKRCIHAFRSCSSYLIDLHEHLPGFVEGYLLLEVVEAFLGHARCISCLGVNAPIVGLAISFTLGRLSCNISAVCTGQHRGGRLFLL